MSAIVALAVGLFGFLLARSAGVSTVVERSLTLDAISQTRADVDAANLLSGNAILLSVDVAAGIADAESVVLVLDAARQRLGALETSGAELDADLRSAIGRYTGSAFAMLDTLESDNLAGAKAAAEGEVASAHQAVSAALARVHQTEIEAISDAGAWAGLVAMVSAFIVMLAVPIVLLSGYRAMARRQLSKARQEAWNAADEGLFQAKDDFLAHVSHELRTPLTGITGFAQVLEDGSLFDPVTGLELVNLIIGQAGELNRMVDDLLVASRLDTGSLSIEVESVDLRTAINEVVPAFERYGAAIPVHCPELSALADPLRLRHVLRGLLANATNHGTPPLEIRVTEAGDSIEIAVIDHGNGVSPEMEPKLFERFVHEGDQPLLVGSVGLGLSVARALARRMGGEIRYERGDQTRFVLELLAAPDLGSLRSDDAAFTGRQK